jgi:uncharacterized protein YdeI (YjbR/CyaY-like superfamily)
MRELGGAFGSLGTSEHYGTGERADHTVGVEVRFFETPAQWRAWLEANHATATEVEVGFRRKATGLPTMTWSEAVDEALCFGWIDGVRHSIDGTSYRNRFTPRKPSSTWSRVNIAKVEALEAAGKMTDAGRAAFARRTEANSGVYSFEGDRAEVLPEPYAAVLEADEAASAHFAGRPRWYRRAAVHWVTSAKREATRERRLAELVECSARGEDVPPLRRR